MKALLDLIPRWLLAVALAAALVGAAIQSWRLVASESAMAEFKAEVAGERQEALQAAATVSERRRLDERRISLQQTEASNNADQFRTAARRSAIDAVTAGGGLRIELSNATAAGRSLADDSAVAGQCKAAGATVAVLAELLGQCADRRVELARYADEARAAGVECVGRYDPLTTGSQ